MRVSMGLLRNEFGVYFMRRKVPTRLQQAVAQVLGESKQRRTWLKKTLATKSLPDAKRRAFAVSAEFDAIIAQAEALLIQRPLRTTLSRHEIDLIANYHFAQMLADDEHETREGLPNRASLRSIHDQLQAAGVEFTMPIPLPERYPQFGLADEEMVRRAVDLEFDLETAQAALARGDVSRVSEHLDELLNGIFGINLDSKSEAYREVGLAVLRQHVKALQAIAHRMMGEPVETPALPVVGSEALTTGETLQAAFAGWQKARNPSPEALAEYERAIRLFVELHGDMPVAKIGRRHASSFREALQDVPRSNHRSGEMLKWPLPQLAEWGRAHPDVPKVKAATVNKQMSGLRAVTRWARNAGFVSEEATWFDPFGLKPLKEDEPSRKPFSIEDFKTLFGSPVFTQGARPDGGRGEAAYWLPVLALFSGGRLNELASLTASNVVPASSVVPQATRQHVLIFAKNTARGRRLKTPSSARAVPVHPELVRLGLLDYVEVVKRDQGPDAWLFPEVSPQSGRGKSAWSKWFGRYLTSIDLPDPDVVFHSFRHGFTDGLRAGCRDDDLRRALLGHAHSSPHDEYGAKEMIARWGMKVLSHAIKSVKYPGLDIPPWIGAVTVPR
jgi:integrase